MSRRCSLLDDELPHQHFHLLWAEGVLHLLDPARSLDICGQLLSPDGYLVCCDIAQWQAANLERFQRAGFQIVARLPWPTRSWWTEFYEHLERRIQLLKRERGDASEMTELPNLEAEVEMIKEDPETFDCAHLVLSRSG